MGLRTMLERLKLRFIPDPMTATRRFNEIFLLLKEVGEDNQALPNFV